MHRLRRISTNSSLRRTATLAMVLAVLFASAGRSADAAQRRSAYAITGATVLLTSHYMADVEALCQRVIIIHHGSILFDGNLSELVDQFTAYKTLTVKTANTLGDLSGYGEVIRQDECSATLRLTRSEAPLVTGRLLQDFAVTDINVEDPSIEEVIDKVFSQEAVVTPVATTDARTDTNQ